MKLENNRWVSSVFFIFILTCGFCSKMSANSELDYFSKKYPTESFIIDKNKLDINIELKKKKPIIRLESYYSYIVLSGNATYFAHSKEYFVASRKVKKMKAYTLVPDKDSYKKIPVTEYFKTSEVNYGSFFDDTYAYNFTFPSICVGAKLVTESIMEVEDEYSPFSFYFGNFAPQEQSVLTVTFPSDMKIIYHLEGGADTSMVTFTQNRRGNKIIYQWSASLQKSYRKDFLAPDEKYFTPHIVIQIANYTSGGKTTNVVSNLNDYYKICYNNIKEINTTPSKTINYLADSITKNTLYSQDKIQSIYKWVQRNIKYVAIEDGKNGLVPDEAEVVLKNRYGDCKGKTSLLVELIKAAGEKSSLAWVGSRGIPYKYSVFPSSFVDNHMIAVWWKDSKTPVILDATTFYNNIEDVPAFIQGKESLISLSDTSYYLYRIPISPPKENIFTDSVVVSIKDNNLIGSGFITLSGEQKINTKNNLESINKSDYYKIVADRNYKATNKLIVDTISIHDSINYSINYSFSLPDYISKLDDNLYLNLNIDRFFQNLIIKENRELPIEVEFCSNFKFICNFIIPEGFSVVNIPKNESFNTEIMNFDLAYQKGSNNLVLTSQVTINALLIEKENLSAFRELLATLNKAYMNSIKLNKL